MKMEFLEEEKICGKISRVPQGAWLEKLEGANVTLSDVGDGSAEIQLLIGGDYFAELLTGKLIRLNDGLTALETKIGWTMGGRIPKASESYAMSVTAISISESSVCELWDLEALGIRDDAAQKTRNEREESALNHFRSTVKNEEDGRYVVALPWMDRSKSLSNNRAVAFKRLQGSSEKLLRQGQWEAYDKIFKDWESDGIIQSMGEGKMSVVYYLPHRAVLKPGSLTTPVRPVFDGSSKSGRSPSLNDCLEIGPNLLELIPSLLLRFREKKYGVTADIRKAFLMVGVHEDDRDFLRFLWWDSPEMKTVKEYRHNRVVPGVNASPFQLGAVIETHLESCKQTYPWACEVMMRSMYVDNLVCSVDSIQEMEQLQSQVTKIMLEAKMELTQWEGSTGGLSRGVDLSCVGSPKVLGMRWDTNQDCLMFEIPKFQEIGTITKRVILSLSHQVFDPLEFLSPVLLQPKLSLRSAWTNNYGWDQPLDMEIVADFVGWAKELSLLSQVNIPRCQSHGLDNPVEKELHIFCDASKDAYAAAIYLRSTKNDIVSVNLLQAKARVAPTKTKMSIPRLELMGCFMASKLGAALKEALSYQEVPASYWSDSSTALSWIKRNDEWGTFVGNRVGSIIKLTSPNDWHHVPGKYNPADLPSRGCSPLQFLESEFLTGPKWLLRPRNEWPCEDAVVEEDLVTCERKKKAVTSLACVSEESKYCWSNSHYRNVRSVAWWIRFIRSAHNKIKQKKKLSLKYPVVDRQVLNVKEVMRAEEALFMFVQMETLPETEIICRIRVKKEVDGLRRVQTKLLYRPDHKNFTQPILLPSQHPVVHALIEEEHTRNYHGGIQFLLSQLREKVWIIRGRATVRGVVRRCVQCRRFGAKPFITPPVALPTDRVKDAHPFQVVGVDLAGPLFIKNGSKVWIVLFTCAVFRCVHLELVQSLSSESFLDAFQLFVNRRGRPKTVWSDNGTNFHGAVSMWKKLEWKKIESELSIQQIEWKFNPASGPWWGGFFERLIGTVKGLFKRTLGNARLTEIKLRVCITSVERVVNGRPLTTVTEDPEDLIPLTPAMFLLWNHATPCPESELIDSSWYRTIYANKKSVHEELQMRFRKEYLSQLVQRAKSIKNVPVKVGDIVFVGSDDKKRQQWPLARVIQTMPGKDGIARRALVKTANGILERPVQRLYPTEVTSNEVNEVQPKPEVKQVASRVKKMVSNKISDNDEIAAPVRTQRGRVVKKPERLGI